MVIPSLWLAACASRPPLDPELARIEPGALPAPNLAVNIPGLGPCTDVPDRTLHLNADEPLKILVHGCFGSSGEFRALAQVLAFHGQQAACFTYNDRDSLTTSATELADAVDTLLPQLRRRDLTVIGHSQGALISRRAMSEAHASPARPADARVQLVTVSGPFAGIAAAAPCGVRWGHVASLGLMPLSCYAVTGAKWFDITYASSFIRQPPALHASVHDYIKLDTDERNTCRRTVNDRCVESDDIFSVAEQRNPLIESDPRARRFEIAAGHVEIVGDPRVAPLKLIGFLQDQGVIRPTPPARQAAFSEFLSRRYGWLAAR